MKLKTLSRIFAICAFICLLATTAVVAYRWGYMQCDIDNLITLTSAPASVQIFYGIPLIICSVVLGILSVVCYKKNGK
ncbi:MAG: hypothetical protein R3Y32_08485 [Bacillota bacterium]